MTYFPKNIDSRLWTHANALCNGKISEVEMRELETILDADPNAQGFFVDFMNVNAEILWLVSSKQHSTMDSSPQITITPPKQSPILGFLDDFGNVFNQYSPFSFMLLILFIGITFFAASHWLNSPHANKIPVKSGFVAEITKTKDCRWGTANPLLAEKTQLQVGHKLQLEKGLAQITYSNGAVVLLEGPASFTVDSSNSGFLSCGKLIARADTRQSWQFTITTPAARFVDLGTEFGVKIDELGRSIVAVFEGKVNTEAKTGDGGWTAPVSFVKGEAAICTGTKLLDKSVSRSEFPSLLPPPPAMDPAYKRWLQANQDMQKRQNLIAYYDFEPDFNNPKVLVNRAPTGAALNGQIQKATWTQGRFDGNSALKFAAADSGVLVNLPGQYEQITLIAWVKINELRNYWNGLFMTNDFSMPGQLHLEIKSNAHVAMYVLQKNRRTRETVVSAEPIPNDCLHRWCMIAAVIDRANQGCFMYVNDMCILDQKKMPQIPPIIIGPATIAGRLDKGNDQDNMVPIRNLACCMDSFLFFNSALTQDEIRRIYESGKPGDQ
jgi:hypothetical protein